jgi:hypothetical protein
MTELLDQRGARRAEVASAVFLDALEWGPALIEGTDLPAALAQIIPEHGVVVRPDFAFHVDDDCDALDDESVDLNEGDTPDDDDESGDDAEAEATTARDGPTTSHSGPWRLLGMWSPWGTHPLRRSVQGWMGRESGRASGSATPITRRSTRARLRRTMVGTRLGASWQAHRIGGVGRQPVE